MILRWLIAVFSVFIAAIFITWNLPGFPALVFATALITFLAANHRTPEKAVIIGAVAGLVLDLITPEVLGVNAAAFALTSLTVSVLRRYFSFETPIWYFSAGLLVFITRSFFVLVFHLIIDGSLLITSDIKGFVSAALFTGIFAGFYSLMVKVR